MPTIREYQTQTRAPGALDGPKVTADQMGAGAGRALEKVGESVSGIGQLMAKKVDQENTSDTTAKLTKVHADLAIKLQDTIRTATPGDRKPFEEFQQEMDDSISAVGEGASSEGARTFYQEASARIKANLDKTSIDGQAELAGIKAVSDYTQTQNNLTAATMADPSSVGLQRQMNTASLEQLVASGQLPREKAIQLQTQSDAALSKAALRGWTDLNPEYAKKKLKSGEFDSTLGADGKAQMFGEIDQAVRAREIEAERRERQQEKVVKLQQQKTQNNFLQDMVDGKLGAQDILKSNLDAFGSGSKEQFLGMLKASTNDKLKTDPTTYLALFNRMHLPDGDPQKLTSENDLNAYLGNGLDMTGLKQLRDEFQGDGTTDGKIAADMKKALFDVARSQLTKSNPLLQIRDPEGDTNMAKFTEYFLTEFQKQRQGGKSAQSLLSPSSPDYLGKQLDVYRKSPKELMAALAGQMRARPREGLATPITQPAGATGPGTFTAPARPAPLPRQPGESAAAYLKRTKQGQ